jgi:hypothetical protein
MEWWLMFTIRFIKSSSSRRVRRSGSRDQALAAWLWPALHSLRTVSRSERIHRSVGGEFVMHEAYLDFWAVVVHDSDGREYFARDPHVYDIHGHELYRFEDSYFGSYFGCGKCLFLDPFQAQAYVEKEKWVRPDRDFSNARIVPVIIGIKEVSREEFEAFQKLGSGGHYKWIVGIADDLQPINSGLRFGEFPNIKGDPEGTESLDAAKARFPKVYGQQEEVFKVMRRLADKNFGKQGPPPDDKTLAALHEAAKIIVGLHKRVVELEAQLKVQEGKPN